MQIIITLAGKSKRFYEAGYKKPKFILKVRDKAIIEHVVEMFDTTNDDFYFVLNKDQEKEFPEILPFLSSIVNKSKTIIIDSHDRGPNFSALQVKDIKENNEVIISYCDFFVKWDYARFKREVYGYDSAIPAFKGFHPASFGNTFYAYMKIDGDDNLEELREKQSFTDKRHLEPASTGIYYFKNWGVFKKYADKIENSGYENLKEGYVSLLSNPMVKDGLKVKVTYVDNFICWGTPEDFYQYIFWEDYFMGRDELSDSKYTYDQVNIIPMAGRGSRFKTAGYRVGKPLIKLIDEPMMVKAFKSFPQSKKWAFRNREDDIKTHPIEKDIKKFNGNSILIPVKGNTSGQAATCLLAKNDIDIEKPLYIASCDYITKYSNKNWNSIYNDKTIDCAIWTTKVKSNLTKDPKSFAYCRTKKNSTVVDEIVEKNTISDNPGEDPLVIGSFWFRRGGDFIMCAEDCIKNDITVNNEHYVGNSINYLIKNNKKVVIFDIDQWVSLGDPFELNIYNYWEEYFNDSKSN